MSDTASKLASLLPKDTGVQFAVMVVDSVADDGTVNLSQGGAIYAGVPCLNSYLDRSDGDTVVVARWGAGWQVLGKAGAQWSPPAAAIPPIPTISWGESAPTGTGWVTGTPWVRSGELYIQTAAGDGSSPAPTPASVSIQPSSQGAWRDGSRDARQPPTQGAWPSYPHPYTGAWFYGTRIQDACSGKTVGAMRLTLARSSQAAGIYGRVQPQMYLINAGAATTSTPSLNSLGSPVLGPGLGLGSSKTFSLPSSWRSALASGAAKGIGVYAPTGDSYLIFTGSCGRIDIDFT